MIVKKRPAMQKGLTLKEIREMDCLSKVFDLAVLMNQLN